MAPGRKPVTQPSTRCEPEEPPLTEYEMERIRTCMRNSRVFRSLGIKEAVQILKKSRPNATDATREYSGSLYLPEDSEDIEQGVFDKEVMQDLESEVSKRSAQNVSILAGGSRKSKRVMAVTTQDQDQPARITRQRTRDLATAHEDTTVDPQDGSTEDGLMAANANTQANNQNELSTEGRCISKSHVSRHVGRDLDNISRGLSNKIPVHIAEGNLRPEEPLQAQACS